MRRSISLFVLVILAVIAGATAAVSQNAQNSPAYKFDATWPKLPLPNKWTFGGITGLTVDRDDVIWVLHRPNDLNQAQNYATLTPPTAECCEKGPAVLAFDTQGNLVRSWDTPEGHLILVDRAGSVWVGAEMMRKYAKDGKLLSEPIKRVPELNPPAGQYPADTPLLVGRVEGGDFDEDAREIYISDSHLRGRILVFDMDKGTFKRGWGAYGKPLKEITASTQRYDPKAPPARDFLGHVTIAIARDGNVYVADRNADRIQVFTKQGKFQREFFVAPATLDRGSAGGMAFSSDAQQRHLFVSDIMNNVVWIVNRADGKTVGRFGFFGHSGGGFHWLHMVATDSKGNIYTGEVDTGERVQRFVPGTGQ
jgi:sugar lactone lactonase YvrE